MTTIDTARKWFIKAMVSELERLNRQRDALAMTLKAVGASNGRNGKARVVPKSRKRLQFRQLQGKYMGHIRQLSASDRVKVKGVKKEKGYRAAIALARRLKEAGK